MLWIQSCKKFEIFFLWFLKYCSSTTYDLLFFSIASEAADVNDFYEDCYDLDDDLDDSDQDEDDEEAGSDDSGNENAWKEESRVTPRPVHSEWVVDLSSRGIHQSPVPSYSSTHTLPRHLHFLPLLLTKISKLSVSSENFQSVKRLSGFFFHKRILISLGRSFPCPSVPYKRVYK